MKEKDAHLQLASKHFQAWQKLPYGEIQSIRAKRQKMQQVNGDPYERGKFIGLCILCELDSQTKLKGCMMVACIVNYLQFLTNQ